MSALSVVRYTQLFDMLSSRLPAGSTPEEMLSALQWAATNFCRDTKAWRQWLTAIDVVAGQASYTVPVEDQFIADIDELIEWKLCDVPQSLLSIRYDPSIVSVTLVSVPTTAKAGGLLIKVVLIPKPMTEEIGEWFLNRYQEGILQGAVRWLTGSKARSNMFDADTFKLADGQWRKAKALAVRDWQTGYQAKTSIAEAPYSFLEYPQ